jgi:hypothetical protein
MSPNPSSINGRHARVMMPFLCTSSDNRQPISPTLFTDLMLWRTVATGCE